MTTAPLELFADRPTVVPAVHDPVDDVLLTVEETNFLNAGLGTRNHRQAINECLAQAVPNWSDNKNALHQLRKAKAVIDHLIRRYEE